MHLRKGIDHLTFRNLIPMVDPYRAQLCVSLNKGKYVARKLFVIHRCKYCPVNQHPPGHRARWMMCGHGKEKSSYFCPIANKGRGLSYAPTNQFWVVMKKLYKLLPIINPSIIPHLPDEGENSLNWGVQQP